MNRRCTNTYEWSKYIETKLFDSVRKVTNNRTDNIGKEPAASCLQIEGKVSEENHEANHTYDAKKHQFKYEEGSVFKFKAGGRSFLLPTG